METNIKPPYITLRDNYFEKVGYPNHKQQVDDLSDTVYLIHNPDTKQTKIGITDSLNRRHAQLLTASGSELQMLIAIQLQPDYDEDAGFIESFLHEHFKSKRMIGEWFDLSMRDIVSIRGLFWEIEGQQIWDNVQKFITNIKH